MPHVSDVRSTSHDRHDPMLVAALAAGDLAGTDRDQAIALTRTCPDCATLHDDLLALARATAAAPPPIATRPRDFQLTPADAARLRPSGWRRLVAAASSSRTVFSRPLGAGLATLGLVGLLVGNVQIGSGTGGAAMRAATSSGAAAVAAPSNRELSSYDAASEASGGTAAGQAPAAYPAASAVALAPAPTDSSVRGSGSAVGSGPPDAVRAAPLGVLPGKAAASQPAATEPLASSDTVSSEPFRPLNLLFGAAVVVGIALLVGSLFRGRRTA